MKILTFCNPANKTMPIFYRTLSAGNCWKTKKPHITNNNNNNNNIVFCPKQVRVG
jgi:hypothetical protein